MAPPRPGPQRGVGIGEVDGEHGAQPRPLDDPEAPRAHEQQPRDGQGEEEGDEEAGAGRQQRQHDREGDGADDEVQERVGRRPPPRPWRQGRERAENTSTTVGIGLIGHDPVIRCLRGGVSPTVAGCASAVDTGGTFTDVVTADGDLVKVPSTPADPAGGGRAAGAGRRRPDVPGARHDRRHQRPARAAGRGGGAGDQRRLRGRHRDRPPGPALALRPVGRPAGAAGARVHRRLGCRAAGGRRHRAGAGSTSTVAAAPRRRAWQAVAVCLLHADLEPAHERAVAARAARPRASTSPARTRCRPSSASTSARSRRWSTRTCGRCAAAYLQRPRRAGRRGAGDDLGRRAGAGGRRPPSGRSRCCCRARRAACGPAAAVGRGQRLPRRHHLRHGRHAHRRVPRRSAACPSPPPARVVGGYPVRLPSLDVHTIGAGGGSIARDRRRRRARRRAAERRAPSRARRATAAAARRADGDRRRPGAGRIPAGVAFPGLGVLDVGAARAALDRGRRRPPRASWRSSTRPWSRRCGRCRSSGASTPRGLALVAFGGAGPLHACALADALGMPAVIVPGAGRRALGGRASWPRPAGATSSRSWPTPLDHARPRRRARPTLGAAAVAERRRLRESVPIRRRQVDDSRSTAATPGRATSSPSRRSPSSTPSTSAATATPGPTTAGRGRSPLRAAAPVAVARSPSPTSRRPIAAGDRPRRHRRARLHDLGAGRLAGRPGRRRRLVLTPGAE